MSFFIRTEDLRILKAGLKEEEMLEEFLCGEDRRNMELSMLLFLKSGYVSPSGQDRKTAVFKLRIAQADEKHKKNIFCASDSFPCHEAAQKLGQNTPHRSKCSVILINAF